MPEQEQKPKARPKLRKRGKTVTSSSGITVGHELTLEDRPTSKDSDFDLDLDSAKFQGKKGQAGTRTKMGGGGAPETTVRSDNFDL